MIKEDNSPVQHLVIGNANFIDPRKTHESDVPDGASKFFYSNGGFASANVTDEKMVVTFIGLKGDALYQIESKPIKRNHEIMV